MNGYMGKMLFVNLSNNKIEVRSLDEDVAKKFIGGPALGAKVLYDEMPANADVFSEESMVGFVTGPLNGTKAFYGGRYTVVSKSPVNGGWNDANSGGFFGPNLKRAGFDAVFVNGISPKPVYIFIDNGNAEIRDASMLWGFTTTETENALQAIHGKISVALIGPSGENLSNFAAVMNDGHRAAGRGGTGAVIGSKKLKALVVKGNEKISIADEKMLNLVNKEIKTNMESLPAAQMVGAFKAYGTGVTYNSSVLTGDAGIKNWSGAGIVDYPEAIAFPVSSVGIDKYKTKSYHCSACPLGCGAFLDMPSEKWNLKNTPRPEYETMGAFGSNLLNGDIESICRANELCNEYGTDTISTGGTISWAIECFENKVLSQEELDGIELTWGNADAIVAMTEKICKNEGVGKILAKGSKAAADIFKKGHEYLVVASGIEEPHHDSRFSYGLSRTYQYDPTPGRHVKGGLGIGKSHVTGHNIDYTGTGNEDMQGVIKTEIVNASGACFFITLSTSLDTLVKMISSVTGFNYSPEEVKDLGLRLFNMRHAFNLREGKRRKDFTLSKRMYESGPPSSGPISNIKVDHELLADNFFNAIGWDMNAVPLKESLEKLGGFEKVISDLY